MNVCEHCGWVGTRGDIDFRPSYAGCPRCGAQTLTMEEREVIRG